MNSPYLKDKILISNPRNCSKINKELDEKLNQMFDELSPFNWLIYQETTYESCLNDHAKFTENIHMLLSYYTSNIEHERITILESMDNDKIEITFTPKNTHKLKGYNFFHWNPNNFVEFLDSSYESYINLKESDFNIDLLIQYYIWFKNEVYLDVRHLLGSIFLEVVIKQYYGHDDGEGFAKKLKNILENKLNLKISKLFEYFEIDLNNMLENIKLTEMKQLNGYDKSIRSVLTNFKENSLVEIFTKYRNKNVHSGEIRLNSDDMSSIFDNSYNKTKDGLNGDKNLKILEILSKNKEKIISSEKINDLELQNTVLEDLMEIILLKYFNTDCGLLLQEPERKAINSKEYVKLFTK